MENEKLLNYMENEKLTIVIHIRLSELLTKSDYETVYNVLFARRGLDERPTIRKCVNRLAVGTRTKMTLNDDDDEDEILIFWRYDSTLTTIPTFESELLSVFEEKSDGRKYKQLNRAKSYHLIGTNTIRPLSPPETMYLKHQIDSYIEKKKPLGEIHQLCNNKG